MNLGYLARSAVASMQLFYSEMEVKVPSKPTWSVVTFRSGYAA